MVLPCIAGLSLQRKIVARPLSPPQFALTFTALDRILSGSPVMRKIVRKTDIGGRWTTKMEDRRVMNQTCKMVGSSVLVLCGAMLLSGCMVLEEKYNAEKARSLNFQRLLAQEEKRTAELDSEAKRTKKELVEFEARNRELTAQVQSAREQMGRLQEETEAIKESAMLERKAMQDMRKGSAAKPKKVDELASLSREADALLRDSAKDMSSLAVPMEAAKPAAKAGSTIHLVKPGETLFRVSRTYGVSIDKLKKWNKLSDDIIEVGQKLIVGME
ncbi:MAG: LysM peptidoglycan-binding domain-containing protein [Nitrospira sp.]|nr:LysM peptidoglycan-binding domain-containing protein [Nitrospira sp.]